MKIVDLCFQVHGQTLPVDHGYLLYSAVSGIVPDIHGAGDMGIHPISGYLIGNRLMRLDGRSSLNIRLPADRISETLCLAGKTLEVHDHKIHIGIPNTRSLIPSPRLYSRLVTIKGFTEPEPFIEAVQRQLDSMRVKGRPNLIDQTNVGSSSQEGKKGSVSKYLRRTIQIREKEVVGFALGIEQLTAEESILVQERGIGGRRRFGCGVFTPDRRWRS